jgi:hypothetical protein
MRQLAQALVSAAMGRSGDDGVRALAEVHRQYANRYPHRYEGATRQSIDREAFVEAAMVANDAFVAVIRSFGHGDHATLQLGLAIFASLHGAVTLEISGFFGDSATADELHETLVAEALQLLTRPGGGPGRIRLPRRPAHPATLGQPRGS